MNISTKIQNAKSLIELAELLNSYDRDENNDLALSDAVDLSGLPTFSDNDPSDTMEVFSWNETHVLIDNSTVLEGDDWELIERCNTCGEADFNCNH